MIKPNTYRDLTKICTSCGFPVIGMRGGDRKACSLDSKEKKKAERSPCQVYVDKIRQKELRAKKDLREKEETEEREHVKKTQEGWRQCIGRLCMDLPYNNRMFWSTGRFNKQCPRCTQSPGQGIPIRGIKFSGGIVDEGIKRKFIPTMVSKFREV